MKIRYFFHEISSPENEIRPAVSYILRSAHLLHASDSVCHAYSKYLFSSIKTDFFENIRGDLDKVLKAINYIENGEQDEYIFYGQGFIHKIGRKCVLFEHAIFGICPHWPLWSCPLSHYKIAIQGWMKFLKIPESLHTELIVELPESDMAQVTLFPPKLPENKNAFSESTID